MSRRKILVLGGARSGKSRYAERLSETHGGRKIYLATAEAGDPEMAERIARHRARRGAGWTTVEAPLDIVSVLTCEAESFVLVDCITLWLTNLLLAEREIAAELESLVAAVGDRQGPVVLVSNEVGLGIVPENALARRFRDEAGFAHQRLAEVCDEVILMVAGLPLTLKSRNGAV